MPTIQQHVKRINKMTIPLNQLRIYEDLYNNLAKRLREVDLVPSRMQFATAVAAYLNTDSEQKQIWS